MDFVKECIFIAPNDESLWTYFALLCSKEDIQFIKELIETLDCTDYYPLIYFGKCVYELNMVENF